MFNRQDLDYLLADLQEYGKTRFEQAKLTLLDKLSRIAALLLLGLAVILIVFAIVAIGGVALISALSNCMPTWAAALIVAAIWLVFLIIVIALRKHLFLNPMLAAIAAILFGQQTKRNLTVESLNQETQMLDYKAGEQEKNLQREAERMQRSWMDLLERFTVARNLVSNLLGRLFRK
ncbi:MAG: hypothetical protein IJT35_03270 [Paludibacteraceae bacterium]|nr:hypothetical protein [Paludibacteraceae bacterium]